ncbi:hypothetical protein DL651_10400 [Escherichia coli]|nr:hypothetical protein [Escherichia coli]
MRRLPRLIMPTSSMLCAGRIRRSRRIRAVVRGCLMRRLPRLIMPTSLILCVGRIRRSRRIRQLCSTGLNTVHDLFPGF